MAPIPAICENCGHVWNAENVIGVSGPGAASITFVGSRVGPCPRCGVGVGRIPDGRYEVRETMTRAFLDPSVTVGDLEKLRAALDEARSRGVDAVEVVNLVRETAPGLADTVEWALSSRGVAVAAWLALLVAVLNLVIDLRAQQPQAPTPQQVEEIITRVVEETEEPEPPRLAPQPPPSP